MKLLILLLLALGCTSRPVKKISPLALPSPKIEDLQIAKEESIGTLSLRVMEICGAKISEARRSSLSSILNIIVPLRIEDREAQEHFLLIPCLETKYDGHGKRSSAGALSIAQIMPQYAQNFSDLCSLGKLGQNDIEDPIVNITLAACLFNHLYKTTGSGMLALAAYNAGLNSPAVRSLAGLGTANPETANYVAKAAILREKIDADKRKIPDGKREGISDDGSGGTERSPSSLSGEKTPVSGS